MIENGMVMSTLSYASSSLATKEAHITRLARGEDVTFFSQAPFA